MNIDRRIVSARHGPSDDSGTDDEENLRVSRCLKTYEQVLDSESDQKLRWPSVCKVIPGRIKHSKMILLNCVCLPVSLFTALFMMCCNVATS